MSSDARPLANSGFLALRLLDVRAGYGSVEVLHGVNLELEQGGSVALLGANGAGKSTMANVIGGSIPLMSGSIDLNGHSIGGLSAGRRAGAGIGVVPEGRGILPSLSVLDNLKSAVLSLKLSRPEVRASVEEAIERFPVLGVRARQRAGSLSGGEQQMLAVSRVLARSPKVIVADEISLGLAPMVVDQVMAELVEANSKGAALIVIEQFAGRALAMTEKVLILRQGAVSWAGKSSEVSEQLLAGYLGETVLEETDTGAGNPTNQARN